MCLIPPFHSGDACYTQLSNKDIRLEQLRKELEVLAAAKQQLDEQVESIVRLACMFMS